MSDWLRVCLGHAVEAVQWPLVTVSRGDRRATVSPSPLQRGAIVADK